MNTSNDNTNELNEMVKSYHSTIQCVLDNVIQFSVYDKKKTIIRIFPAYIAKGDMLDFLTGVNVWILFEDKEPSYLSIAALCKFLKIRNTRLIQLANNELSISKDVFLKSISSINHLLRYCGITGTFDELPDLLKGDIYKYYQISDYSNWYQIIEVAIENFKSHYLCEPQQLTANEATFGKIGYIGTNMDDTTVKNFGNLEEEIATSDIFPELLFVFYDHLKDDQFVLVFETENGETANFDIPKDWLALHK